MKILALDISKKATGVAIGDGEGPPRTFSQGFKGERPCAVGAAYAKWLRTLLVEERPALVAFEKPLILSGPRAGTAVMVILTGLAFATGMVCEIAGIRYHDVAISTWRKLFLGTGRPKNPKLDAINACQALGWDVGDDDNQADACGVWFWAHWHHGNGKGMIRQRSRSSVRRMAG